MRHFYNLYVWTNITRQRAFITNTYYDEPMSFFDLAAPQPRTDRQVLPKGQKNLRNRVASTVTRRYYKDPPVGSVDSAYEFASHYSYDVVGNVQSLVQETRELHVMNQGFKTVSYDYDQLSGKVNAVIYQTGQTDQFAHRYVYDDDNKLITAYTSTRLSEFSRTAPQPNWQYHREASYEYYQHGPLARTELGDRRVQGIDYAYNLQGWLKGINSDRLDPRFDVGADGYASARSASRRFVGRDAFGFSIGYFQGDYTPIGGNAVKLEQEKTSNFYKNGSADLFNGNIRNMRVGIRR